MREPSKVESANDDVANRVDDAVDENPWFEKLTAAGWIAKGTVYILMGLAAVSVARQSARSDEASPEGSLAQVSQAPFGRVLLSVLAVGLFLYFVWRSLSVVVIRGSELTDWADRIGYSFSAIFYLFLGVSATRAVLTADDPGKSNTIESLSKSLLGWPAGRWLLGVGGVATIAVGLYFAIRKGIMRSFADDLVGVSPSPSANAPKRRTLVVAGIAGWIGRGIVTCLVGFFVVRASIRFDSGEARGFDRTLREVAGTSTGSILVWVCAIGLVTYGLFCLASYRFRELEDTS